MMCIKGNTYVALNWRDAFSRVPGHNVLYTVNDTETDEAYPVVKGKSILLTITGYLDSSKWFRINKLVKGSEWVLIRLSNQSPVILKALSVSLSHSNVSYIVQPNTYVVVHEYIDGEFYVEPIRDEASPILHMLLRNSRVINLYIPTHGSVDEHLIYSIPMDNVRNVVFDDVDTAIRFIEINRVLCSGGKVNCECSSPIDCALNCRSIDVSVDASIS
ncbi:hypothetical protein [Caldivirga maquilingensis]|uniref:Uncharacterized protein n=1 Tax=Caldivirga maquilingensis (strain ATCC 700844 / DSM 13496 / JCM 10307 / IC-167) TaxID=397948 RepID=A8ME28_CALMQ|nr:hypothetical protein [Caldivirga maquilingensis]ABW02034.1 hypothetical protein Cmaq_1207 [Caldivirga maquilingensis IC-167]